MANRKVIETSKEAFLSLQPEDLREMYRKIMKALSILGIGTFEDIATQIREPKERVWKRLSELGKMELIFRPGIKRILKSGRKGFVWQLTSDKNDYGQAVEKSVKGKTVSDYSRELIPKTAQQKLF